MKQIVILRTIKDVFEDKKGKYWFDIVAYLDARENPRHLSDREIGIKIELSTEEEIISEQALLKRIGRFNKYVDNCKGGIAGIDTIKQLGVAFRNDEMAFLIPITLESFISMGKKVQESTNEQGFNEIYRQLNKILYLLELSCYYNYIPNTEKDGEAYFKEMMDGIHQCVDKVFSKNQKISESMHELVNEVEFVVNSCSVPGVPDSWIEINPNIKYFDCIYDIIEGDPALFELIKTGDLKMMKARFSFYPTISEIIERQRFFEYKRKKYPTRSIDRLYQDELVETLNMRFSKCVGSMNHLEAKNESKNESKN